MHDSVRLLSHSILWATLTSACGAHEAAAPPVTAHHESPQAAAQQPKEEPKEEATQDASPTDKDPREEGLRKASRPPAELITGPNLVYVFNFKESEVGIAAKERCAQENDDPGALGACLQKARSKVPVELVRFIKEPSGDFWFVTYNRYKGNLLKWHRVQFQPGEATDDRITLNLIGEDKGIAPMPRVPRHVEIDLPNDYSIVVKDHDNGAMFYDAKIGMMDVD
jgi:hypothetical protein